MVLSARRTLLRAMMAAGLTACSGGSSDSLNGESLSVDYSALQLARSREGLLVAPRTAEQFLRAVRNGLRMSVGSSSDGLAAAISPGAMGISAHSTTNVQVDGVDEADAVKYDGRHIFSMRQEQVVQPAGGPSITRNVLKVFRTSPDTARTEAIGEYSVDGEQSAPPLIYQLQSEQGAAEHIVVVSQDYRGWLLPALLPQQQTLTIWPDRTTIQLLDVRDPARVSQSWKIELDGWLKASRKIGDMLYLVSNYRPRLPNFIVPAVTASDRDANERRIRKATASALLPSYWENGVRRDLVTPSDCLIPADLQTNEAYSDLLIITAIDLRRQRVTDVTCLSTYVNSVYMSTGSLYVAGSTYAAPGEPGKTVLHKFALDAGSIHYRASGAVTGSIGWNNPSYYMDEYHGDLRILTTRSTPDSTTPTHHLSVLRETGAGSLQQISTLPNDQRPAPIGKPGEQVWAVRFFAERAYVVTARIIDPLYILDLANPADPVLAGELEIPGVSTYLRPLGAPGSQVLLSVGRQIDAQGRAGGVKVELFDVRDAKNPRSLGVQLLGGSSSSTSAFNDPHALTFLTVPGNPSVHRLALPVDVFDSTKWIYSGLHLLEVYGAGSGSPQLYFQGMIKTAEAGGAPYPASPTRGVMHGDSVFAITGGQVLSSLWEDAREAETVTFLRKRAL